MASAIEIFTNAAQMLHNADIDVIQCLHAITFSTGLTQHNNLLNLRSIPTFTFIKHGIGMVAQRYHSKNSSSISILIFLF